MQHVFDTLELYNATDLYLYTKNIDNKFLPLRINKSLHAMSISPHSIFILDNRPMILFFEQTTDLEEIFKQCWNFSETPIIVIENEVDFNIYNGYEYILEDNKFLLQALNKDSFNYISIISGEYINETKFKKQDNRVDKVLLKNIKDSREELIYNLLSNSIQEKREYVKKSKSYKYKNLGQDEIKEYEYKKNIANSIIGRIIFIRYLIDREVSIGYRNEKEILTNDDLIKILGCHDETYKLFKYLKSEKGFNGDWFPLIPNEEVIVQDLHLKILQKLINGYDFNKKQGTLFNFYNFSIIPIEFISNVYESFIGEDEQSKNGAYYTPTFLVDYVLKHTVDEYFKNNPNEYNCKVLDPACGSGIFLVETLRKLISQFKIVTGKEARPDEIVKLVKDNIYAVDKDRNAILVSVFSLYLTMLDYQNPKDIEQFLFPYLLENSKNQSPNFFNSDFFDINAPFNNILLKKELNFIIGNPPYGRGTIKNGSYADKYAKSLKLSIGNQDLVQPFMVRVKDLSVEDTNVSFIVTSKVLYNLKSSNFRTDNFFNNFKINHVLELSSVRKDIFENADVPVSILFYKYASQEEVLKNNIHYVSMKPNPFFKKLKCFTIGKTDYKKVAQSKLLEYDYLWKVLVYGSYMDFNLIKRIKLIPTIQSILDDRNILYKKGIKKTDGNKKIDVECLIGYDYLDSRKEIESFYISDEHQKWLTSKVGYVYKQNNEVVKSLYHPYSLLTTKGVGQDLRLKSAISTKKLVFQDTIFAIKGQKKDLGMLKNILGLYNSSLFSYYMLLLGTSIGTEREQAHNIEKLLFPFIEDSGIISMVEEIERLKIDYYQAKNLLLLNKDNYSIYLNRLLKKLDRHVLSILNFSEEDIAFINYALDINIPWIIQKKSDIAFEKLHFQDEKLEKYINIFLKHYSKIYENNNMFFNVEVMHSDYAIGIKFNVLKEKPKEVIIWKKEKQIENFIKLSGNKTLDNLFIQKDIKGFEQDSFYVVKPNEYKNWHEAIGYLDFYEFQNAILRSEV